MTRGATERALFDRLPRLADLVPFVPLADGLPTPVDQVEERLWVQRDDLSDSRYGGNKVRKLEHLLAIAARRGGPVLTAGARAATTSSRRRCTPPAWVSTVEAVRFPQPDTAHVEGMAAPRRGARRRHARAAPRLPCRSCWPAAGPSWRRAAPRS